MSVTAEREMGFHIVKYLEAVANAQSLQKRGEINELTEKLSKLFDVNTKSVDDFLALEYYHSDLNDILQAGVKSTEAGHFEADLMEAQTNDKFKSFSSIIASRQYFDGCSEGTLEHLRRRSRVLSKFREKYPKTDLTIDDPNHPLRKILSAPKNSPVAKKLDSSSTRPSPMTSPVKAKEEESKQVPAPIPAPTPTPAPAPTSAPASVEEPDPARTENPVADPTPAPPAPPAPAEAPVKETETPTPAAAAPSAPPPPPPPAQGGQGGKKKKNKKGKK